MIARVTKPEVGPIDMVGQHALAMFIPARVRLERLEVVDDDVAALLEEAIGLGCDRQPIARVRQVETEAVDDQVEVSTNRAREIFSRSLENGHHALSDRVHARVDSKNLAPVL